MSQAATLNARQLQQVLDYCRTRRHGLRDRTMILVSHWSGMRVKEIAALRWSDVVNSDGTIKAEVRLTADQTKGQRRRTVLLPQRLQAELARYAAANQARPSQQPVFATERSSGFSANTLTHVINGIYRSAGLDGATSHSGRRTFITTLAESGVSARVLMSLAGHQNLSTTQRYIDIKPSMLRAAVELL
jgi:integrase/recombinase XerD